MAESNIKLIGPEIKGRAGEKVRLSAEFAVKVWSCIHERRDKSGYVRIHDQKDSDKLTFDAEIHDDTTYFIVSIGDKGRPDLGMTNNIGQVWCPVVVEADQTTQTPPDSGGEADATVDLGKYLYSIMLLSDSHVSKDSDEWWDEADFRRCMDMAVADTNIKAIMGSGDLIESGSPKKGTPEDDSKDFRELYDVPYWQTAGLRLFSPMGNHDFYGTFESRAGDTITGAKNTETTFGYNASVAQRIGKIWPTDGGINGIVPGRGRIVFELEAGKHTVQGQADMSFFAYNAYVDLYAKAAGYTASVWDTNKGGIADAAIRTTKNYVSENWAACRDNLSGWKDSGLHGRNAYSKLSYWLKKDNDIFIFLSVDYGNDVWPINGDWHDRMIHARTILNLNADDPYVKRMKEYVSDTSYDKADEPYNYQYYSVNSLIWLKEIIENNTDKKIYIFTHHFIPNRAGNGVGLPCYGDWQYADIHPSDEKDPKEGGIYPLGSNALTGIQYWFFDKLLNSHKNVILFSGHSHISFSSGANFDNHDYFIRLPIERDQYVYTKISETPKKESAWTVSLPSMSKPRNIIDGQSVRRYEDAEMAVMEIYERGVKIKGYKVRENNQDVQKLLAEKEIQLI